MLSLMTAVWPTNIPPHHVKLFVVKGLRFVCLFIMGGVTRVVSLDTVAVQLSRMLYLHCNLLMTIGLSRHRQGWVENAGRHWVRGALDEIH